MGSTSLTVDRSGGALQVLGTPQRNVIFTSWLDESIGRDTQRIDHSVPWRLGWFGVPSDMDRAESRPYPEDQGIFLNYVNQTTLSTVVVGTS